MLICATTICRKWYIHLKNKPFMKWTVSELFVTGYLVTFNFDTFNSDTYGVSNTVHTDYHIAFCTILFSTFQGRVNRHKIQVMEVSHIQSSYSLPVIFILLYVFSAPLLECIGDET